jgi:hypothetical protein
MICCIVLLMYCWTYRIDICSRRHELLELYAGMHMHTRVLEYLKVWRRAFCSPRQVTVKIWRWLRA